MISMNGEFQILEADRWTRTPVFDDNDTFVVPLSTYVLIEDHIKGVTIANSEKNGS